VPFGEAAAKATGWTTISCGKSEAGVSLVYDDLALSRDLDRGRPMRGANA
jgi:hypothetical protein